MLSEDIQNLMTSAAKKTASTIVRESIHAARYSRMRAPRDGKNPEDNAESSLRETPPSISAQSGASL